ncbi:MAG: hypothetical protein HPY69_17100 [Armatimonadetes bacterium]|nr:hypothetical protein [Armatimonadota bacterium]
MAVTVGAGDGFGLSLVLSNPYAPAVSVKREGPDGLVLVLERPDAVGQLGDALALSLDGRRLASVPVQARVKLPLRANALRPGKHVLVADLLRSQRAVASGRCEFASFDESPLPFHLADADVSAYYAPVVDAFPCVRAAKALFRLGCTGLPDSLEVDGCELLAGGVRLVSGGRPAACALHKTRAHRNGVAFVGRSPDIELQGSVEFDGLAWYEVKLALPRPTSRAYLEVPLRFPEGSSLFLSHGSWSQALPEGRTWVALTQGLQVTDGQRGLSLYLPPRAADLNLESYDRIVEVRRRGALVTLRLHLSDGRLAAPGQRVRFAFGLQPFPFRDYPDDANFRYRIVRAHGYDYRKSVRPELLAAYKAVGTKYMIHHEWWNPLQSYYRLVGPRPVPGAGSRHP